MANVLAKYKNGNYTVILADDGTKIRVNDLDNLTPSFAESIDCTITTKCDGGCPYCYLECNESGEHADLSQPFFDTLHKGQELALNGNDLSHPDLLKFLVRMRRNGVICNITLNQKHFMKYAMSLKNLATIGLVHGIGVSLTDSSDKGLYDQLSLIPNTVVHVIDGLTTKVDIDNMNDKSIKMLVLGYKPIGRGKEYLDKHKAEIDNNIKYLRDNLKEISRHFDVVSFDNLAIEHLNVESLVKKDKWDELYMGDEGQYTFFIDAVNKKFAVSSLSKEQYNLMDNVDDMFKYVRRITNDQNVL